MKNMTEARVSRNGIRFRGLSYWHPELLRYAGTKTLVRLKRGRLEVYDCHGRAVCTAKADVFTGEAEGV